MNGVKVLSATISIHAPREGSDTTFRILNPNRDISIHAPREGSDTAAEISEEAVQVISIHAPREGSDSKDAQ